MAGLISSLQNSSAALRVHSKGLEITGKNLANVNNRGYSKERVEIGDRGQINTGVATESMGVEAMGLRQNRDALLDKSVMRELTATADLEAAKKVLTNAETALGQFLDRTKDSTSIQNAGGANGGGISDALTDFFNAWESFSVKPNDIGEKQLLIAKAQILAEKISKTDERLAGVQSDVDAQVSVDVDVVNQILDEIAEINGYIAKAELVKPYSAVDLRDKRQAKIEELSKYVDVTFSNFDPDPQKNLGRISVELNGVKLVNGEVVEKQLAYDKNTNVLSIGVSAFQTSTLPSGKIGAQIKAAYDTVQDTRDNIKDLAETLTDEVNGAYQANGGVGDIFSLTTSSAGLLKMSYNSDLALKAGASGGNQIALAVAELGTKVYSASGKAEFVSDNPHGFADGDKVFATQNGLMWVASGIDPAKAGVTDTNNYYVVEKVSDTSFHLKNGDSYLDETTATSPITTVTKYEELSAESTISGRVVPYITEFSFPNDTFADGDQIQFTFLPAETPDVIIDSKLVYTLQENPNGTFRILKPDGSDLQITEDDIYGVDRLSSPKIQLVSQTEGASSGVTSKLFGGSFYGDFDLANAASFKSGDQVKLTNLPAGSVFEEDVVYTLSSLTVDPSNGAILTDGDPVGVKVYQFNDINGNPISGANQFSVDVDTLVTLITTPAVTKSSIINAEAFDSAGQFWGEFIVNDPSGFAIGQSIAFSNLPAGSNLSESEEYKISDLRTDLAGKTFITIKDSNGNSVTTGVSDIDSTTKIVFEQIIAEGSSVSFNAKKNEFEGSFGSYFNSIVTVLAQELNNTNTRLEDQKLSEEMAVNSRDQYSGVSQDEEITDMMKFQRSFQASARHINVIDTLLEQVVNRLGVG